MNLFGEEVIWIIAQKIQTRVQIPRWHNNKYELHIVLKRTYVSPHSNPQSDHLWKGITAVLNAVEVARVIRECNLYYRNWVLPLQATTSNCHPIDPMLKNAHCNHQGILDSSTAANRHQSIPSWMRKYLAGSAAPKTFFPAAPPTSLLSGRRYPKT